MAWHGWHGRHRDIIHRVIHLKMRKNADRCRYELHHFESCCNAKWEGSTAKMGFFQRAKQRRFAMPISVDMAHMANQSITRMASYPFVVE